MAYNDGLKQHQNMARGDGVASGDFGCQPIASGPAMAPVSEMTKGHTPDGDRRGAGMPVKHTKGKHPSQAMPDHGPHGPMMGKDMP